MSGGSSPSTAKLLTPSICRVRPEVQPALKRRVVLGNGVTVVTDGDQGIVKVRAPKEPRDMSGSDLAAILMALPVRQIIDQGFPS